MLSQKDKQGIVLIFLVLLAGIIILVIKLNLDSAPKPGKDNCFNKIESNTVILLDYTDPIPQQTKDEIAARTLKLVKENVKLGERVSIFKISEVSNHSLKPVLSLCKPAEDGNRATENIHALKKNFENNFLLPLKGILSTDPESSNFSPIAEAITDISLSQYLTGRENNLVIFSDMIEHSNNFSLYKCTDSTNVVSKYRQTRIGAKERPTFVNTNVKLNIIPRLDLNTTVLDCRTKLWSWFFGDNEGSNAGLTSEYLPGGVTVSNKKVSQDAR